MRTAKTNENGTRCTHTHTQKTRREVGKPMQTRPYKQFVYIERVICVTRITHQNKIQDLHFVFVCFFGLVFVANDSLVTRISIQDTGAVVTLESGWPNRNQLSSIRYASHQTRWPMRQFSTTTKKNPKRKKTSETHRHTKGRGRSSRCFGNDKPQCINIQQPK